MIEGRRHMILSPAGRGQGDGVPNREVHPPTQDPFTFTSNSSPRRARRARG